MALDKRLVQISIEVNGVVKTFDDLRIVAFGTKYANALQNEAVITIYNLTKADRDYILTETSPYNQNPTSKIVRLYAGRESYGTELVFIGNVVTSSISQPPDIGVTLKCLTGNFQKGNVLVRQYGATIPLRTLSQQIADDIGLALKYQATDKNISNYAFSGAALNQIEILGAYKGINVFIDNNYLVVKDAFTPLANTPSRILNIDTGLIGIPTFNEQGIRAKYLLDQKTVLGGTLEVTSELNRAVNGDYVIYKLGFQITNRDTPFYYIAEAARRRNEQ